MLTRVSLQLMMQKEEAGRDEKRVENLKILSQKSAIIAIQKTVRL